MDDRSLQSVVLGKVARWRRLPLSDLFAMLTAEQRLAFREHLLLKDLEAQGLITIREVGDEPVLAITEAGERWLAEPGGR